MQQVQQQAHQVPSKFRALSSRVSRIVDAAAPGEEEATIKMAHGSIQASQQVSVQVVARKLISHERSTAQLGAKLARDAERKTTSLVSAKTLEAMSSTPTPRGKNEIMASPAE